MWKSGTFLSLWHLDLLDLARYFGGLCCFFVVTEVPLLVFGKSTDGDLCSGVGSHIKPGGLQGSPFLSRRDQVLEPGI